MNVCTVAARIHDIIIWVFNLGNGTLVIALVNIKCNHIPKKVSFHVFLQVYDSVHIRILLYDISVCDDGNKNTVYKPKLDIRFLLL